MAAAAGGPARAYQDFLLQLAALARNDTNLGLTHGDYLLSNMNITAGDPVTVYDFDECAYGWSLLDIAVYLYYFT